MSSIRPAEAAVERLTGGALARLLPAPLTQRFTLAHTWADLARLAGEPTPPAVAALLDGQGGRARPTEARHDHR